MPNEYLGVITRFLRKNERFIASEAEEMPLVLEAQNFKDLSSLHQFLSTNSTKIIEDMATYGAVLLRGFAINSDQDFEDTVLSIKGFSGINEAFMSEEGRIHADNLRYVLHTNAVYKTGGTLYLGGFHSENYYSTDVPSYICFCCFKPSLIGGETGLVNMEKVYTQLSDTLKAKLEQNNFFVAKWLVQDIAARYHISPETVEKIATQCALPLLGEGKDRFVLMYKPNIFEHSLTKKKALQINLFEIATLNEAMRACFMQDYPGKAWFWHRFFWRMPTFILKTIEFIYIIFASFSYSPKNALKILLSKLKTLKAARNLPKYNKARVGSCFTTKDIKELAQLIRTHYSSCLWQKGDILLVDNKKVAHAGMPGAGPRLVRAMICNPLIMDYNAEQTGSINCQAREAQTIGASMALGSTE